MQDKTINNALLELRKQAIRGSGDGLAHVEALLTMRGVHMPRVLPAKRKDVARKGEMTQIVLKSLRDGPKALRCIVEDVVKARPHVDPDRCYNRATQALYKMKRRGLVVQDFRPDGCLWKLAP
ncbi:hypothetical protein [Aliiroseovarius sp. F47248L]|uniref:hypothetical protein n=1 Tax=Aliiroseovarius sp. F47248L TaxID=2926420 RepID=UPI001FF3CA85|nr:hypothetical protein [Aliiroseovarius sp. F47248L]MCK0139613.1 hypothetical protein [Aliiroseovarius sp. F47248L]